MPNLSSKDQWEVGRKLAELVEPFPLDQRLLVFIAGLYGEARRQGMSSSAVVDLVQRVVALHEQGQLIQLPKGPR